MNRRKFLQSCAIAGAATGIKLHGQNNAPAELQNLPADAVMVPDEGWHLWIDKNAVWKDDEIFLPEDVNLQTLPAHPPTGGWGKLYATRNGADYAEVTLPTTVEQYFWGKYGLRPYTPEEYRYAADDPVPQNGAYIGVSWWWREITIPEEMKDKRIVLKVRGARMRAEVFLNEKLVGYSIMEELPFECDVSDAAKPGEKNTLAIRITNPGGRYDWVDGTNIPWGKLSVYRSHGFAGLDRELVLYATPHNTYIEDAWVLNTKEPRTVTAYARFNHTFTKDPVFEVLEMGSGKVLARATGEMDENTQSGWCRMKASLHCADAKLWDLSQPNLYQMRTTLENNRGEKDVRLITFGFRWFAPEGLGKDAIFRLNGRRIKIYTSISWGYWGLNGLWPTPELAEREVKQAQKLGLNCLNFHRNVGKEEVMRAHDRIGLLRYMEPGGGKMAIGKLPSGVAANSAGTVMQKPTSEADKFAQQFMLEKCRAMVKAFRSHPSLIQYTLQNEIGADLNNPETFKPLEIMRAEDPSRSVALNDGFSPPPRSAAQAWFEPYNDTMHRSDQEEWAGWWNNHQGAGDQWYDEFYKDSEHYTYNESMRESLVEYGEMEGCAVADDHARMVQQIEMRDFGGNGKSYDLADHKEILKGYKKFLDRWGFRKAFPTTGYIFSSLGDKCYASWQQYLENIRINDAVDFAAISGWESTAMENHSGIVDNLRNFKGFPWIISSSLRPVRLVAKQHKLCYAMGESAVIDLYLLNDTGQQIGGKFLLSIADPHNKAIPLGEWNAPANIADQFSYTLETNFKTPMLDKEGVYAIHFRSTEVSSADIMREIWVANTKPKFARPVRVAVSGIQASMRDRLHALTGIEVTDFAAHEKYDLIIASGIVKGSKLDRQVGEETGLEAQPAKGAPVEPQIPGEIPEDVLAAVKNGTPLLAAVPEDSLADGVAKQLAAMGAFTYSGQIGNIRAPWMGNWLIGREHATFAGLRTNEVLGVYYQAHGKQSNGLKIERAAGATDPEVILGYSRDHDREIGAASFVCHVGKTPVLVHRAPPFNAPLQQRWLANAIAYLAGVKLT